MAAQTDTGPVWSSMRDRREHPLGHARIRHRAIRVVISNYSAHVVSVAVNIDSFEVVHADTVTGEQTVDGTLAVAIQPGVAAGGSQAPVVNSWVRTARHRQLGRRRWLG